MISIVHNEVSDAIEVMMDAKGAELLIRKLQTLVARGGHLHLYGTNDDDGVALWSPYPSETLYGEIILNLLDTDAWTDTKQKL